MYEAAAGAKRAQLRFRHKHTLDKVLSTAFVPGSG